MVCVNSHVEVWDCGCQLFGRLGVPFISLIDEDVVEVVWLMRAAVDEDDSPASAAMGNDDDDGDHDDDDPS